MMVVGCPGVKDLVVVKTADAVLVCRRGAAQELKRIVRELEGGRGDASVCLSGARGKGGEGR